MAFAIILGRLVQLQFAPGAPPEGAWFKRRAEEVGFKRAVQERDSGEPIAPEISR
jgi:hypothetical protein